MKKVLSTFVLILCVLSVFSTGYSNYSNTLKNNLNFSKKINKTLANPFVITIPQAFDDYFVINEDVVLNDSVKLNDVLSADGGNVWSVVTMPLHGSLIFNTDGTFQYTPELNYFGFDTITYKLCDIDGDCDTAKVFITITSVNDLPYAFNDNVNVNEDAVLYDSVTFNDLPSGDGGNIWSVVTQPVNGVLVFNANGTFTYTPAPDFDGNDTITYKLCDIDSDCDTAMVFIVVNPMNEKPVANNDFDTTDEDTPVVINVFANDTDIDGNLVLSSIDIATAPLHGSAVVNSVSGLITYTPSPDYNGTDSFKYKICDDGTPLPSLCDTALVSILINPVNDLPYANTDYAYTPSYNAITINVLYNDTFGGDGPCACAITATNGAHGTTTINNNGTATNPVDDKVVYTPNTSYHGPDSFTYTISDLNGDLSTATVHVDVTNMFAPSLTTPTNGATGQMPNAFLVWAAVPGAFNYLVQVCNDSLFTATKNYETNLTAVYSDHLYFNTKYYWRVKAYSSTDSSGWSGFKSFKVVKTVTITKPADSAKNRPVSLYFKWAAITGISKYEYQIDNSLSFSSPLFVSNGITSNEDDTYSKELAFGTNYYLRMRAMHSQDTSDWSAILHFSTLDTFNLHKPKNDTVYPSPVVKLEWDYLGSGNYEYALSTDSLFTIAEYETIDTTHNVIIPSLSDTIIREITDTLLFGQKYFWKARGVSSVNNSEWTYTWKFTTIDKMTLLTPAKDTTNVSTIPTFTWEALTSIHNYILELDTNQLFLSADQFVLSNDTNFYTISTSTPLLPFTKYYWRMKATTSIDSTDWSDVFNFTTTSPIGIESLVNNSVSIYPNPSINGKINIQISAAVNQNMNISIINMVGQEIYSDNLKVKSGANLFTINLINKDNGIYFVKLQNDNFTLTRKIIINR